MAYNLEPITRKENLLGLIAGNPHAEPREAITREEAFLSDIAENGLPETTPEDAGKAVIVNESGTGYELGSGGSSLPPYTPSDVDKVLGLAEDAEHPTQGAFVPEQEVELYEGSAPLSDVTLDIANVNEGDTAIVTITASGNTQTYNLTAQIVLGDMTYLYTADDDQLAIFYDSMEGWSINTNIYGSETVTLSATASVPSVSPAWVQGGGGVFKCGMNPEGQTTITIDGDTYTATPCTKTYAEITGAYAAGALPVMEIDDDGVNITMFSYYKPDTGSYDGYPYCVKFSDMDLYAASDSSPLYYLFSIS